MVLKRCSSCGKTKDELEFSKVRKNGDRRRTKCKECCSIYDHENKYKYPVTEYSRNWAKRNPRKRWVHNTLCAHRKRFNTSITVDELLELANKVDYCPICGTSLNWSVQTKGRKPQCDNPSLDRIHCDKPFDITNAMIVCYACNLGKATGTLEEYVKRCKRITDMFTEV